MTEIIADILPAFTKIRLGVEPPVAQLVLENPPVNVIDLTMMGELLVALGKMEARADVSVLVLSGAGVDFSAGVDIKAHSKEKAGGMLRKFHAVIRALANSRKVTVAAVHGNCLGGGAELAMMCDMLFCTENARFQFPEIQLACFPPVAAVALAAVVGQKRAAEMILTGNVVHGDEALHMGLANDAVGDENELSEVVQEVTERLTSLSPTALAITKRALYCWDAIHFDKGLQKSESIYTDELLRTEDAEEGIRAWIEKRQPMWKGR